MALTPSFAAQSSVGQAVQIPSLNSAMCLQVGFVQFTAAGDPLSLKGDYFAGKGVGWAQHQTPAGLVDTFNTHLSANYKQAWDGRHGSRCPDQSCC